MLAFGASDSGSNPDRTTMDSYFLDLANSSIDSICEFSTLDMNL